MKKPLEYPQKQYSRGWMISTGQSHKYLIRLIELPS